MRANWFIRSWHPSNTWLLGSTRVSSHPKWHLSRFSRFLHISTVFLNTRIEIHRHCSNSPHLCTVCLWWGLIILVVVTIMCVCLSVCPRSKRKTAWAIYAKHGTYILYSCRSTCIDPKVKRSRSRTYENRHSRMVAIDHGRYTPYLIHRQPWLASSASQWTCHVYLLQLTSARLTLWRCQSRRQQRSQFITFESSFPAPDYLSVHHLHRNYQK